MQTRYTFSLLFAMGFLGAFAQPGDRDKLGTEVVNVVRPYSASVSDAFKVRETPVFEEEVNAQREEINYSIFSFPVASTFTPAKGKAAALDRFERDPFFKNFATVGIGNYGNFLAELYVSEQFDRNSYLNASLRHFSSQGGIREVVLDDAFSMTRFSVNYGQTDKSFSWNVGGGYQHQLINWYGLPSYVFQGMNAEEIGALIRSINAQQVYHTIALGGDVQMQDSFLNGGTLRFTRFSDAFSSGENRLMIQPELEVQVSDFEVEIPVVLDHLGGSFARSLTDENQIKYAFTNIGASPTLKYAYENWNFKIGARLFYMMDGEGDLSKFHIYPNLQASIPLVEDLMIFYSGIDGGLEQNSFQNRVELNPFVSPTLGLRPTDRAFEVFAGLKGKLASNVSYHVKGAYRNENHFAFFQSNAAFSERDLNPNGYVFGNSFGVVFGDLKTLQMFGELKAEFSKDFTAGIYADFNSYSVSGVEEAWNLPAFQLGANLEYKISPKWMIGSQLFYVGARKDLGLVHQADDDIFVDGIQTVPSFFDLNASLKYMINKRFSAFVLANNITGQSYQRWLNTPVQQFQIMGGINGKFDF